MFADAILWFINPQNSLHKDAFRVEKVKLPVYVQSSFFYVTRDSPCVMRDLMKNSA